MGKKTKATKKFEKNNLKHVIENRKEFAKIKQRHQKKDKQKQRNAKRAAGQEEDADIQEDVQIDAKDDVDQDDFFQDTLQIPEDKSSKKSLTSTNGKRKLDEIPEQESEMDEGEEDLEELDMAALAEKDPEFHKYLKENDPELLDFDEDDELDDLVMSSDDERPSKKRRTEKSAFDQATVTVEQVKKWRESMQQQYSIRALREVVLAFRAAASMDDDGGKEYKYTIPTSQIYHEVLMVALKDVPQVLQHHLPVKETAAGRVHVNTGTPQFKKLSPVIKTFAVSLDRLLASLNDSATLRLALQSFEPLLPYLLQFRKFLKQIIKSIAAIWSDNTGTSNEPTRIQAFLILRRLLTIGDAGLREAVLKSAYENLIKSARGTSVHTLPGINLMKNSAAELWAIDTKVGYTTAFQFIRQAAIHLRTNITKPTKESYKTIYNWQFVHSLDFWSRVLSASCNSLSEAEKGKQSELRPLIYPVVQITLGVMRLIPTSTYFPLRFHLMRSLMRVSQSTGTYIPLASALLEVLNSPELKKPSKATNTNLKPLDFSTNIRAPSTYAKTRIYQTGLGEELLELWSEYLVLWCKSIAYPEFSLPPIVMLKRWLKAASKASTGNKNAKLNQGLLLLVQKSEANSKWILERRNKVTFTPRDRTEVEAFLKDTDWSETPFGAFVSGQRVQRERAAKTVKEGREEEKRRQQQRKQDGTNHADEREEDEIEIH